MEILNNKLLMNKFMFYFLIWANYRNIYFMHTFPTSIYLFKVNIGSSRNKNEIVLS